MRSILCGEKPGYPDKPEYPDKPGYPSHIPYKENISQDTGIMPYVTRVRVINKQSAKVLGMCDTDSELDRVIREKVIIVFSMETPCWSPSDGLQHGGRKPVETFGVYFGYLKTFLLSVKIESIRIKALLSTYWLLRTRKHKKQCRCHHSGKTQCSIFKTK